MISLIAAILIHQCHQDSQIKDKERANEERKKDKLKHIYVYCIKCPLMFIAGKVKHIYIYIYIYIYITHTSITNETRMAVITQIYCIKRKKTKKNSRFMRMYVDFLKIAHAYSQSKKIIIIIMMIRNILL